MTESFGRIRAMALRYLFLHKRSLPRTFEIILWPVMELFVWGFVSVYIQGVSQGTLSKVAMSLINAMIFWDILYRSQQGVSISFIEDIWTQNIVNLLVSPLKIWEWVAAAALYGLIKAGLITLILTTIAFFLYHFNLVGNLQWSLFPLVFNLLLFGWALGIFTSSLVIRWGHSAEALIWGVPFLIQPLSAIFYPLSVLPLWLQPIARLLPSTYVFEGMRSLLQTGSMPTSYFFIGFTLNIFYFLLAGFCFDRMYSKARTTGRLGRLGMD
ncbi:MAG: hypothetical protein AUJ72_05365 [Candidatus Omnitrophica bacterium CG1_02_46_14]|nr:MAG: hypothetical protein AUJ72_05365 [Candidatus Omnitrophica bacterium CG1_02_46_14]